MMPRRTWGPAEQKTVAARQKWTCACCTSLLSASFQLDHIVPLWDGGEDNFETNAQALCGTCHADKTQREQMERTSRRRASVAVAIASAKRQSAVAIASAKRQPTVEDAVASNPFMCFAYMPGVK